MKKWIALILILLMIFTVGIAEEAEKTVASYEYFPNEEGIYLENLIYNADVVINGENTQIIFSNCELNGDIHLNADEGTRVLLLGCTVNGTCYINNQVTDADLNYNNPKFLTDAPVTVICENGAGSAVALGDFEVNFNGESYSMEDSQFFFEGSNMVPYEGQEASYCVIGQYYENGEKQLIVVSEYDPAA